MRHLGLCAVLLGACIPDEPEWLAAEPRYRGVALEVVEPGGYSTQLNVPPGRRRATALPLDTLELSWHLALPPGAELQPPIWIDCGRDCVVPTGFQSVTLLNGWQLGLLDECPQPLPLQLSQPCRLGEGHTIRVGLGGAFTLDADEPRPPQLLIVGSRDPEVAPATCLERLATYPLPPATECIFAWEILQLGPWWAALPFDDEFSGLPPEFRAQEADTHPEVVGFDVTRERGGDRIELVAGVGDDVPVRRGERVTVAPRFAPGSAQEYWYFGPSSAGPTARQSEEVLTWQAWFSAPVDAYDPPEPARRISWTVPHDVVPTTLYLDVKDSRSGRAYVELQFVPDPAQ